jgi:FAD/FMN-containing dehydrogenase
MYPIDIGARGSATIGGNIATNAGGNRVLRFGMTREQVLGLEVVLADGEILSSMNTLLKNNAGYDLKQLFIGSEGTLGIVTRAVLRLRPALSGVATALLAVDSFDAVLGLLPRLTAAAAGGLSSFEVMWGDFWKAVLASGRHQPPFQEAHPFYVLVEMAGSNAEGALERAIEAAWEEGLLASAVIAQSQSQAEAMWAIREDLTGLVSALEPAFGYDISLPQRHMDAYCAELRRRLLEVSPEARLIVFGHLGDCNLHIGIANTGNRLTHAQSDSLVYALLAPLRGSVSAEHGIGLDKRPYLGVTRSASEIALMRRLKMLLDPHNLLNPGKVVDLADSPAPDTASSAG